MQIVVLGAEDSWYVRDLQRAAADQWQLTTAPFSRIRVEQSGDPLTTAIVATGDTRLDACDVVLVRTMPPGSLEQVVFRMDALATLQSQGVIVRNSPKAIEAAVDKFLCNTLLNQAGLKTPPTVTCQDFEPAMEAFHRLGGDVVVKPIFGGEGRGLLHIDDENLAYRTFRTLAQLDAVLYLQPYLQHDFDLRLLRIGDQVLGMRRERHDDWRTNISQGGKATAFTPDVPLCELAFQASDAVGADIAGVDVLLDENGGPIVIEVNAVPGWRALSRVHNRDVARMILDYLAHLSQSRNGGPFETALLEREDQTSRCAAVAPQAGETNGSD